MQTNYRWTKKTFGSTYQIFSNDTLIGNLVSKSFSQTVNGEINSKKYTFKTTGFFSQSTEIIDNSTNSVIGNITYNSWMTKASITIHYKAANWQYNNIWNTKWNINDNFGMDINYAGSSTKGHIESNTDDDLLLLTGLFVTNYYWQTTIAVMAAVFIPIYVSVFS